MPILEPGITQRLGQRIRIELRIVAGSRNSAYIGEKNDVMGAQQADEFIDRSRRMAESPEGWSHAARIVAQQKDDLYRQSSGWSLVRGEFFWIQFQQAMVAVRHMFDLEEAIANVDGGGHHATGYIKRKISVRGVLEQPAYDG